MDEIFNPSLLISLGPSSKKALDFSKKLLSYLPSHFLNLIDYYDIQDIAKLSKDLQEIIDTKLLCAKYLNNLVDLGYKVRSQNTNSVKLNLYLFWDVYNADQSCYEVVKEIYELNYGNIDKDQHSGASLFIIPIMEKEWGLEESRVESVQSLEEVINFISQEEKLLVLDSKVFLLHCISNDGTRIPKRELEYICGTLTYLNVLPSKDPPLSHFNPRILMNEAAYKVGTIGITSLTVFKEQLLDEFSKYMAVDILNFASVHEEEESYRNYKAFGLLEYESIDISEEEGRFLIKLPKDIEQYPEVFKKWEEQVEQYCTNEVDKIIDIKTKKNTNNIMANIEEDLRDIVLRGGFKGALNYIDVLQGEIHKQKYTNKSAVKLDTSKLNAEMKWRVDNNPNTIGYIIKCVILAAFLLYSIINLTFSLLTLELRIILIVAFFTVFSISAYLDYKFSLKNLNSFIEAYKEAILKNGRNLTNSFIHKSRIEGLETISNYLEERKQTFISCISNAQKLVKTLNPLAPKEEEELGNLITDLLSFKDRYLFYKEKCPRTEETFRGFSKSLGGIEEFASDTLLEKISNYTRDISLEYVNLDFFEYAKFKYKEKFNDELNRWIDKGIVKSKYLLQYINNEMLEEHSIFITSPEVLRAVKGISSGKLANFEVSVIEGEDVHANCISIIRLCLGVDLNNITPFKKLKGRERNA
jgi:hypothetical protein